MVAERDYPRTSERIERLIVDALIPLILEETVDVVRLISQEHIQRHMVKEPVGVSVPQDAIEDCNKDQLSNTTARIEAVEKSISELHESMINNAAATELLKLAVNRLQAEAPFQVRNTSYLDEVTSQATEKKEDLKADTAKHSSVLETAISRSTLDGEISSRDRISQHTMEPTLDVPMPEMVTQSVEVPKTISQNRIQQRTMKQIVDDPVVQVVQIPRVQVVKKTVEDPQFEITDKVIDVPVVSVVQVPQVHFVKKTVEDSTVGVKTAEVLRFNTSKPGDEQNSSEQYVDRMKEGQNDMCYVTDESIAVVSSLFEENLRKKGHEVPYMADPVDEKKTLEELKAKLEPLIELMKEVLGDKVEEAIVDDRTVDLLRVLTTSGHGLSVNMKLIMKAQASVDNANVSTNAFDRLERQQHNSKQQQQPQTARQPTRQEREKERGERKKEEREAEERRGEQVKKDVTDWTVVTRNRRQRKMVQIFVRVNGSKVTPMEVNLTDDSRRRNEADPGRRGCVCDTAWKSAEERRKDEELRSY